MVTTQKKILITLIGVDNVTPGVNYKTFTFTLNPYYFRAKYHQNIWL